MPFQEHVSWEAKWEINIRSLRFDTEHRQSAKFAVYFPQLFTLCHKLGKNGQAMNTTGNFYIYMSLVVLLNKWVDLQQYDNAWHSWWPLKRQFFTTFSCSLSILTQTRQHWILHVREHSLTLLTSTLKMDIASISKILATLAISSHCKKSNKSRIDTKYKVT
jgi:hypothetical protein